MYAALNVVHRNVRCRQRTLGTTSCSQSYQATVGMLNICDIMLVCIVSACIVTRIVLCLQCFDAVGWASGRASGL